MSEINKVLERPIVGDELQQLKDKNDAFDFSKTGFNFLDEHKGLRAGHIHVILGETGTGKSSLVRSVAERLAMAGEKIVYYSAEENIKEFSKGIDLDSENESAKNFYFISEKKLIKDYQNFSIKLVENVVRTAMVESGARILFFDNPTAGSFIDKLEDQVSLYNALRKIADDGVCIVCPTHTKGDLPYNQLFKTEHIKGSKKISSVAEYFYAFYQFNYEFEGENKVFAGIQTLKARWHLVRGNFYYLNFDRETKKYISDRSIKFQIFLDCWKKKPKL